MTTAVTWTRTQAMLPEVVPASSYPTFVDFAARAEQLPEFAAAPHGAGTCRPMHPSSRSGPAHPFGTQRLRSALLTLGR